jgi:glycosyltransferase involved in cell wall biosynthesis
LPLYYQNASLFVFPSLYEGFGLPVLEALAAKTMVISSNAASLPEIGGEAVIYFDPKNDIELSQKIKDCLKNKVSIEIEKRAVQLDKFTWKKSIKNHLEAFRNILQNNEKSTN